MDKILNYMIINDGNGTYLHFGYCWFLKFMLSSRTIVYCHDFSIFVFNLA